MVDLKPITLIIILSKNGLNIQIKSQTLSNGIKKKQAPIQAPYKKHRLNVNTNRLKVKMEPSVMVVLIQCNNLKQICCWLTFFLG